MLSGDHKYVDPEGVEAALITASCVDYSSAGTQAGLNGTRNWQVVDSPGVLLHFSNLLISLATTFFLSLPSTTVASYGATAQRPTGSHRGLVLRWWRSRLSPRVFLAKCIFTAAVQCAQRTGKGDRKLREGNQRRRAVPKAVSSTSLF